MLTDIINRLQDKMITDLKHILREMSIQEARSKIKAREEKYQRQYAMRAFNAHKKQINKKIIITRTKHK